MKVAKTFRLSEKAVAELDKHPNATQYLEQLILGNGSQTLEVVPLHTLQALLETEFEKLGSQPALQPLVDPLDALDAQAFVPRPPDPTTGYPCCQKAVPCKHWSFDGVEGVWRNSLTGKVKEA